VNTIRQDPRNPRLLYAGTEFGFFVSLDEGGSWHRFMPNLPVVRIDDVVVHPRENDLVLATHGRSIWIMDDISALQDLTPDVMEETAHLFEPRAAVLWKENIRRERAVTGDHNWLGESAPEGTAIHVQLGSAASTATLRIVDPVSDEVVRDLDAPTTAGLHRIRWDLRANPDEADDDEGPTVDPGTYRVVLTVDGTEQSQLVEVLEDTWMPEVW
jgi:hypothetical protein